MPTKTHARLVGLEPHLTVRSRTPGRIDLWFALERSHRPDVWDNAFRAQAAALADSRFCLVDLFPFTPRDGWIVVRGAKGEVPTGDFERVVLGLVAASNAAVGTSVAIADPAPRAGDRPLRFMRNGLNAALREFVAMVF